MAYELLIGAAVAAPETYERYRTEMAPLLAAEGGWFRYDFDVARVRAPAGDSDLNRVFAISFPDKAARERFFAGAAYQEIRARLFTPSVSRLVVIAEYSLPVP